MKAGRSYKVRFLKDLGRPGWEQPKGSTSVLTNWHCNKTKYCRQDWWDKLVVCHGHGDFSVYTVNEDIEVLGEVSERV